MSQYLFLFTISPVQSFIAQARKTRDLYNGSRLLTDLIKHAIEEIKPAEPIFPQKGLDSYPNRFIAIIEKENDDEMKKFGDELKTKVQERFEELATIVINNTKIDVAKIPSNFKSQIQNHFNIQWVAIPYDPSNYKEQFREIESLLGAVKNIREFEQFEETGRKCSLCGERNVLFYNGNKHTYIQSVAIKVNNVQIQKGEGLCAVCFTKRFFQEKEFPSTAEIALKDTVSKIPNDLIENYKKSLNGFFDCQLLFEENLTKKYFDKQNIDCDLEKVKKVFQELKKAIQDESLMFTPYYAVVVFDGDSMGKWLSGANLKPEADLQQFHKILTKALGDFAKDTYNIVSEEKGKIVYAGGEDFLAFVNLNHLFDVLKKLRVEFDKIVNNGIGVFKNKNANLSFSAGIIIAPYKMPLAEVLKWAREMEKEAKKKYSDKNAFAVAVMKHSGEINKTVYKWGNENSLTANLDVIEDVTNNLKQDKFSNTFIKTISKELLSVNDHKGLSFSNEILSTELNRLIKRACKISKNENEKSEDFKKRKKELIEDTTSKVSSLYINLDTESFISSLNIAEFISRYLNGGKNEN